MKDALKSSVLYNNRHILGFFAVAIILYIFIVFGFANTPVGLSSEEMNSAVLSAGFSFPDSIINMPYNFLQWLNVEVLGLSIFSLRLPSIILALFSSGLIIAAINNITRNNIAIMTGLLISSSVFFLNFARSGTPEIMGIFLMSLAVFAISQVIRNRSLQTLWLMLLATAVTLGIYLPGGIIFLTVILAVALISPKSRAIMTSLKPWKIIVASVVGLIALAPLVYAIVINNDLLLVALGVDGFSFMPQDILTNLKIVFSPFGAEFGGLVTPILSIGGIALSIVGIVKLIRDGKSARTAFTLSIACVALMITILSPNKAFLLFVPWVFLMAFGLAFIIDHWYKLFPLNPYARVLGMIPIGILLLTMMFVNHTTYLTANYYNSDVVNNRNFVFKALRSEINALSAHEINLVVPKEQMEFYSLFERSYPLVVATEKPISSYDTKILLPGTFDQISSTPTKIVSSSQRNDFVLLEVYQK